MINVWHHTVVEQEHRGAREIRDVASATLDTPGLWKTTGSRWKATSKVAREEQQRMRSPNETRRVADAEEIGSMTASVAVRKNANLP